MIGLEGRGFTIKLRPRLRLGEYTQSPLVVKNIIVEISVWCESKIVPVT
jgi:hypothetical protein